MPTSELVRYSGPKSRELNQLKSSDSSSFGSGGEDWITRKRVETKTVRNIEKRIQRQVVLEDGRVIEEDDPQVTLDTIEDVESHSDDADDDIKNIGGSLVPVRIHFLFDVVIILISHVYLLEDDEASAESSP